MKVAKPWLILLFIGSIVLTHNLNKPFYGHHDWNGVYYGNIAKNYLNLGFLKTKLGQVTNFKPLVNESLNYYTHYPPLFPILLALTYRLLGQTDLVARLLPVSLTLAAFTFMYLISLHLTRSKLASFASGLVMLAPMIRYFAKMPSQEALIIFLSCLSVYCYLTNRKLIFYLSVLANGLSGWAGYFLYPLLFFLNRRLAIKACFLLLATFTLHLLHTYLLTGSLVGGGLVDALLLRLGLFPALNRVEPELPGQFSLIAYIIKQARILTIYYTLALLSLSSFNLLFILRSIIKKIKLTSLESILLVFLFWGLSYPLIFSNVVFVHEYFNLFLWPFLALSLTALINRFSQHQVFTAITLVILAFLLFWERNQFYLGLNQSAGFKPGYELGTYIQQTTLPGETSTVVKSKDFIESQNLFIEFYGDRKIEYTVNHEK
ncbi:MAG: hypothetical protein V1810_04080 [Candidatus Beckwithbacteria bacterium]